jgi:hypothetical protein
VEWVPNDTQGEEYGRIRCGLNFVFCYDPARIKIYRIGREKFSLVLAGFFLWLSGKKPKKSQTH